MQPKQILEFPAARVSENERRAYFDNGYLAIDGAISQASIERLQQVILQMVEDSRAHSESDGKFVLEEGHSATDPRLHRLISPEDHYEAVWDLLRGDEMTSLAAEVVGPDVKFYHAKLNFKSGKGSRGFHWHQDIPAWPHTDFSPVTIGVYIEGCTEEMGPLSMIPGSNHGPLYSMYDETGNYANQVRDGELSEVDSARIDSPTGPPGTAILLNCRTIHGSLTNRSHHNRPLLLAVYSSADSFSYTSPPIHGSHLGEIVRGQPARFANFDTRACELPPDWGRIGYVGPWKLQKESVERG